MAPIVDQGIRIYFIADLQRHGEEDARSAEVTTALAVEEVVFGGGLH